MKILYLITSSHFGGAETLFLQHITALDKSRFEPLLCSIKPMGTMAETLRDRGVRVVSLDWDARRNWLQWFGLFGKIHQLKKIITEFKPAVIHTSLFQADILGTLVSAWCGVPVRLVTLHMILKKKWLWHLALRFLSPLVTRYLAVSKNIQYSYAKWFLMPKSKMAVLYNAVDVDQIRLKAEEKHAEFVGDGIHNPLFIFAGRLDPQKNIPLMIEAFGRLIHRGGKVRLFLLGDGPLRENLQKKIDALRLAEHVTLLGFMENPFPYIKQSRALVLSSAEEGLPMVALEAMALGRPVISTAVGALQDVLIQGKTGILVPPRDAAALADAISRLGSDIDLARNMGEAAFNRVLAKFSLWVIQTELENLYEDMSRNKVR